MFTTKSLFMLSFFAYLEIRISSEHSRDVTGLKFVFACLLWVWRWCCHCFHAFTSRTWKFVLGFREESVEYVMVEPTVTHRYHDMCNKFHSTSDLVLIQGGKSAVQKCCYLGCQFLMWLLNLLKLGIFHSCTWFILIQTIYMYMELYIDGSTCVMIVYVRVNRTVWNSILCD